MSSGSGKVEYWEYHGSLAGIVCAGPVEVLEEIVVDGETVWSGSLARNGTTGPATVTIDSKRLLRFYWGTEDQPVDPILQSSGNSLGHEHPTYSGLCYLVLVDFWFGRERVSAPNLEVVVRRAPVQSIVSGSPAALTDGQASPVATLADLLTHPRYGLALGADRFGSATFQSAASALHASGASARTAVSTLLNRQATARSHLADLALVGDFWLRHDAATGMVVTGVFPHEPIDVEALPVLTSHDLVERPRFRSGSWGDVETGWAVAFPDRARAFKESTETHDDLRALRVLGEPRRSTLQRPSITRREQALAHAREWAKVKGQPSLSGTLVVRRERAEGLRPGMLVVVDIDPEPGGEELRQVFRILERTVSATGPTRLSVEAERMLSPTVFVPDAEVPPSAQLPYPPEVAHARVLELPPPLAGGNSFRIGILAERPHDLVTGCAVHYDSDPEGDFLELGSFDFFALRGAVSAAWSSSASEPVIVNLQSSRDRGLLDADPGAVAARNDTLLLVLVEVSATGEIAEDGSGGAILEVCSVESLVLTAPDTFALTVLRGRAGTTPCSFSAGAEAWILPRSGLQAFAHADFGAIQEAQTLAQLRLRPYSVFASRALDDCVTRTFRFPTAAAFAPVITWLNPSAPQGTAGAPPQTVTLRGRVDDRDGNLTQVALLHRLPGGSETTLLAVPLSRVALFPFEHALILTEPGTHRFILRAQDASGRARDAERVLELDPVAGQTAAPVINPAGGGFPAEPTLAITCATSGATIVVATGPLFASTVPTTWQTWNPAAPVDVLELRLWAKATAAGLSDSAVVWADFWLEDKGRFPPYHDP